MKKKKLIGSSMFKKMILSLLVLFFVFIAFSSTSLAQTYAPLEKIPGSTAEEQDTFPEYIQAIYKFAVWSVGIAALLMISIGGFMYFTSAGNNSRIETAKKIIGDAIFGLVAVMVAWIILYKINPDLVNINLNSIDNLKPSASTTPPAN